MKTEFQSGDIQLVLDIHKRRVEYLMKEVPILPEISQVEGTGRAHKFSYKNVVEFFIAEQLFGMGLGLKEIRFVLGALGKPGEILKAVTLLPRVRPNFFPEGQDVAFTEWPLDLPKGGLIVRFREYGVVLRKPEKIGKAFKNYYRSTSGDKLWLTINVFDGRYHLTIAGEPELFGVISTVLDLGEVKRRVNKLVDGLVTGELEEYREGRFHRLDIT